MFKLTICPVKYAICPSNMFLPPICSFTHTARMLLIETSQCRRVTETLSQVGKLGYELRYSPLKNGDDDGDGNGPMRGRRRRVRLKPLGYLAARPSAASASTSAGIAPNADPRDFTDRIANADGSGTAGIRGATIKRNSSTHTTSSSGGAVVGALLPSQQRRLQEKEGAVVASSRRENSAWSSSICVVS